MRYWGCAVWRFYQYLYFRLFARKNRPMSEMSFMRSDVVLPIRRHCLVQKIQVEEGANQSSHYDLIQQIDHR